VVTLPPGPAPALRQREVLWGKMRRQATTTVSGDADRRLKDWARRQAALTAVNEAPTLVPRRMLMARTGTQALSRWETVCLPPRRSRSDHQN
jgi:hypothetical protein